MKTKPEPESPPEINMAKIRVGGETAGLIFAAGVLLLLLVGVPPLRWFAVLALILGLIVGGGLWVWHRLHPSAEEENDSLKLH